MIYIHVLDEFSLAGGGVRSVVADVAVEMAKRGLKVYICPLGIPEENSEEEFVKWGEKRGVGFCLLRGQKDNLLKASFKLRSILRKVNKSDNCCLYLHLKRGVLSGILASLGLNDIRRVEVFHSNYINYRLQAFFCRFFIDKYLPVSKESEEQLISFYRVNPNKISLAYNGVNIEVIRNSITPIKRDSSLFRILSVGRMDPQKNLETSISAFCEFSDSKDYVRSEYIIAGDGPQRKELEKIADGKVCFLGMIERNQVCSNIAVADVMLFPSLWEGHSIALLEVLAIGCPVIVTDIPAFREVLGNKPLLDDELFRPTPFGALFHKGNKESCKAAINYMAHNKGNTDSMRQFVLSLADNYTVSKQVDVYVKAAQK